MKKILKYNKIIEELILIKNYKNIVIICNKSNFPI